MSFESVCAAYGARAAEYIEAVGGVEHASEADRAHILAWARGVEGRVLDVGSGPGQWTDHLRRQGVAAPLEEFARVLAPGGSLLLGFFTGARLEPFDHAVATAYYWPTDLLAERLEQAGFAVRDVRVRFDPAQTPAPGRRPEAIIAAVLLR